MAATYRDRIREEIVRKSVNALLKWKAKSHIVEGESDEENEKSDDFVYLSLTLMKIPSRILTLIPHKIPLRHSLVRQNTQLSVCLIVDGKEITLQSAHNFLKSQNGNFSFNLHVLKLSKLKSAYKAFESKKKLYDSFDVFLAVKSVVSLLPVVLGKVFYKKKRKVPVPVELKPDCSNWKEEIETAVFSSSLLCLNSGTCCALRVGKWGVNENEEIVENVFDAVDRVLDIVPKKWGGIRCLHLKFSNSVALPIYDCQQFDEEIRVAKVEKKRKRTALLESIAEESQEGDNIVKRR